MKRLTVILSALLLAAGLFAADKVVQSSAKRAPKWLGGMEEGYFIASAEGQTLDEAQERAITRIREQIIYAIATNVKSATTINMKQVTDNGDIRLHEEVTGKVSVRAADIPYLANISPSHAEEYYWQKLRRSDKSEYYAYHVKYPLSNGRLRLLINDYEKQQQLINDTLQAFASTDFATYDDLDEMLQQHRRLKQFAESLPEDDSRQNICRAIRLTYERMITQNLQVEPLSSDKQETKVTLTYGARRISYSIRPKMKSNCLTAMQAKALGDATLITYDFHSGCYEDEQNYMDVIFTVLGKKISTRCYIQ